VADPALVLFENVAKVYEPMPRSLRFLLRSQVDERVHALRGVSLQLDRGDVCVVIGPNGAGKSTLFRILTGLTTPTEGRAFISGLDTSVNSSQIRRRIGFAPAEERTLLLRHTCRENLAFHGAMQGLSGAGLARRIEEVLEFVGLGEAAGRAAVALSTGMRARLQLARALLHDPDVLILDEPTSAIDPVSARSIIRLVLRAAKDRGAAVLLSSHRLEEIESLGDHVLLLDRGEPVFQGDLASFTRTFANPLIEVELDTASAAQATVERAAGAGITGRVSHENPRVVTLENMSSIPRALDLVDDQSTILAVRDKTPTLLDVLEKAWRPTE
jgi:ABC-2 type transport system ATP-binding protein